MGGWNFYQYPLDPVNDIDPLGLWAWLVIPGLCAGGGCETILVALGLSTSIAGQQMQANASSSTQSNSLTKCEKIKSCPPCNPPAGEKFNIDIHYEAHTGRGLKDGTHGCLEKTGSPVHWHYDVYDQNPNNCDCIPRRHKFGGCGMPPV